jgi:hypothetical protein
MGIGLLRSSSGRRSSHQEAEAELVPGQRARCHTALPASDPGSATFHGRQGQLCGVDRPLRCISLWAGVVPRCSSTFSCTRPLTLGRFLRSTDSPLHEGCIDLVDQRCRGMCADRFRYSRGQESFERAFVWYVSSAVTRDRPVARRNSAVSSRRTRQHILDEVGDNGRTTLTNEIEWCFAIQLIVRHVQKRQETLLG